MNAKNQVLLVFAVAATSGGCQCEKLFPDKVAMGVARLSARNIGTAISLVAKDTRCGFASAAAISNATFSGPVGGEGTMTVHIDRCVLDLGTKLQPLATDCSGVETRAAGTVTVSGTQTIVGRSTGSLTTPMVPLAADAVSFDLTMSFASYEVRASDSKAGMRIDSGSAHVLAKPHLGVSASSGVCSISTTDLTIDSIEYDGAHVQVDPDTGFFPVDVPTSNFAVQVGRWGDRENDLTGKLTVWDHESTVPSDHDGLQPGYQRADFEAAMACTKDLAQPLSYECKDLDAMLAENLARLTVSAFGRLASAYDGDTTCGFASPQAQQGQTVSGAEVGRQGATVTIPLTTPCELRFDSPTVIRETCNGVQTIVQGTVSATGVKDVSGLNTGNPARPIIPNKRQAGRVTLQMDLSNLSIRRSDMAVELRLNNGRLSGHASSALGLDTTTLACSIKSSAASLEQVKLENADVLLISDGKTFALPSASTDLTAVNGRVGQQENTLVGSVVLGGRTFPVGTDSAPLPLDPNYDAAYFLSDDACLPNYQPTSSDADCDLSPLLGGAAARFLVQTAGAVASMVNSDTNCGFANTLGVLLWPTRVVGDPGQLGSMTWRVSGCSLGASPAAAYKTNCHQTASMAGGSSKTDATRTVVGEREKQILVVDSIKPLNPKSVTISLDAELSEFSSYDLPSGESRPSKAVTWHSGTITGVVEPYTGDDSADRGRYDIPTPLAHFRDLSATNGDVTINASGLTFRMQIDQANIEAQNGVYLGQGNFIQGDITVDGHLVHIAPSPLNVDYDQASFDDGYRCTPKLVSALPSSP
jgi:hypothetical protein